MFSFNPPDFFFFCLIYHLISHTWICMICFFIFGRKKPDISCTEKVSHTVHSFVFGSSNVAWSPHQQTAGNIENNIPMGWWKLVFIYLLIFFLKGHKPSLFLFLFLFCFSESPMLFQGVKTFTVHGCVKKPTQLKTKRLRGPLLEFVAQHHLYYQNV